MNTQIDKSRLFKRAWYLVKKQFYTLSQALKKVWAEMKEYAKEKASEIAIKVDFSTPFKVSADSMQAYYNSTAYKGD